MKTFKSLQDLQQLSPHHPTYAPFKEVVGNLVNTY